MNAKDLVKGSIVEIPVKFSPERRNIPTQVKIERCTEFYLWFKYSGGLQRIGRNTFDKYSVFGYKIVSI